MGALDYRKYSKAREEWIMNDRPHRQEPGPSRRIFFGKMEGRDLVLEPSSDYRLIIDEMQ